METQDDKDFLTQDDEDFKPVQRPVDPASVRRIADFASKGGFEIG